MITDQAGTATRWMILVTFAAMLAVTTTPAAGVTHLKHGAVAPPIKLNDLDGTAVSTDELRGRTLILIFGELYHGKTLEACRRVEKVAKDKRLRGETIVPILIVAQDLESEQLKSKATDDALPSIILHDLDRKAFETYRVAVLPSVVVVDKRGRVAHTIAAFTERFDDMTIDALLLAAGKLDLERFNQRLHPDRAAAQSPELIRAHRLTKLAGQLSRRGLVTMAEEKYAQALELRPDHAPAHLGMGSVQLKRRRWAEAEQSFRTVLSADPDSVEAAVGLAFVQAQRGGEELAPAAALVRRVLIRHESNPRAHYLLGLILEKQGNMKDAAASFKKAAELLLAQAEPEAMP